jgi:hypothetical protein
MKRMLIHIRRKTNLGDLKGEEPGGVHWVRVPITFSFFTHLLQFLLWREIKGSRISIEEA